MNPITVLHGPKGKHPKRAVEICMQKNWSYSTRGFDAKEIKTALGLGYFINHNDSDAIIVLLKKGEINDEFFQSTMKKIVSQDTLIVRRIFGGYENMICRAHFILCVHRADTPVFDKSMQLRSNLVLN
jgi:hypothetical protein